MILNLAQRYRKRFGSYSPVNGCRGERRHNVKTEENCIQNPKACHCLKFRWRKDSVKEKEQRKKKQKRMLSLEATGGVSGRRRDQKELMLLIGHKIKTSKYSLEFGI